MDIHYRLIFTSFCANISCMEILPNLRRIILTPGAVKRERQLHIEYPTKVKPPGWQTTDPLNHDPNNFRYIIHATSKARLDRGAWDTHARGLGPEREYENNHLEVLIADLLSRNSISCSMIDELHRGTYASGATYHGFILDVPEENIIAIDPIDLGVYNLIQDKRLRENSLKDEIARKNNTPTSQDFMNDSSERKNNEVLIDGIGPEGRSISITGIFIKNDPILEVPLYDLYSRLSWSPRNLFNWLFNTGEWQAQRHRLSTMKKQHQEAKDLAQLLHVPLINIPAPL